jgi:hypothetical protein
MTNKTYIKIASSPDYREHMYILKEDLDFYLVYSDGSKYPLYYKTISTLLFIRHTILCTDWIEMQYIYSNSLIVPEQDPELFYVDDAFILYIGGFMFFFCSDELLEKVKTYKSLHEKLNYLDIRDWFNTKLQPHWSGGPFLSSDMDSLVFNNGVVKIKSEAGVITEIENISNLLTINSIPQFKSIDDYIFKKNENFMWIYGYEFVLDETIYNYLQTQPEEFVLPYISLYNWYLIK